MNRTLPLTGVALGIVAASLVSAVPASAQVRVGVGVRVAVARPAVRRYYYRPYRAYPFGYYGYYAWSWYPDFYGYYGYPQYPPYYGAYGRYLDSASLRLDVRPRQTEVYIDGYYAGTVDDFDGFFQRLRLEPGEHDLQLYLPGYRVQRRQVYLQPDRTFRVRFTMVPLAPGDPQPERPEPSAAPPSGPASAPPGGPVTRGPVRPAPRDREPGPPPPREVGARESGYGTLAVRVQPADAEIMIDGERWDSSGGDQLLVQLSAGVHHLEARKAGYRLYATDVTVRPGETAALNVALSREPQ